MAVLVLLGSISISNAIQLQQLEGVKNEAKDWDDLLTNQAVFNERVYSSDMPEGYGDVVDEVVHEKEENVAKRRKQAIMQAQAQQAAIEKAKAEEAAKQKQKLEAEQKAKTAADAKQRQESQAKEQALNEVKAKAATEAEARLKAEATALEQARLKVEAETKAK